MGSSIRSKVALSVAGLQLASVSVNSAVAGDKESSLNILCDHAGHKDHEKSPVAKVGQFYKCAVCSTLAGTKDFPLRGKITGNVAVIYDEKMKAELEPSEDVKLKIDLRVHRTEDVAALYPTGSSYYLAPDKLNESAYALFVQVIQSHPELTFMAVWAARSVASLYQVSVRDGALMINKVAWPSELNAAPKVSATPDERQVNMLTTLLESSVEPFELDTYQNEAKSIKERQIAEATGVAAVPLPERDKSNNIDVTTLDLTAALENAIKFKATPVKASSVKAKPSKVSVNA